MKRECLLSKAYTGPPMTFNGSPIFYSGMANEILREFQTAFFCGEGKGDQTHFHGLTEGIMVMSLLADGKIDMIQELREADRSKRHASVTTFGLIHEDEIERLRPEIIARVESAMAASVESEGMGKSHLPPQDSSP